MLGSLMIDSTGDLIEAIEVHDGQDYTTIGVALGSQQVAQALSLRTSTRTRDVWFNRAAGIDYNGLFYHATRNDTIMNPIRAQAFREEIESTPGFGSYADTKDISFTREGRKLTVNLPCVIIACDYSRFVPTVIEQ